MSTVIKPEISIKNPYWIEKHRYYELKHFCLQYPIWKKILQYLDGTKIHSLEQLPQRTNALGSVTEKEALIRTYYSNRVDMVERVAAETDEVIGTYILKGVTEGIPYDLIKARLEIPCCKDVYYNLYRRFFWLLDQERQ